MAKSFNFFDRLKGIAFAWKGIQTFIREEPNGGLHLLSALVTIAVAYFLGLNATEWMILILTIVLVIAMEAMNTAVETLTDLVSPEYHALAGKTKDIAAAAVLITGIGAFAVALILFLPKIIALVST